jgi:hypothetical protein
MLVGMASEARVEELKGIVCPERRSKTSKLVSHRSPGRKPCR